MLKKIKTNIVTYAIIGLSKICLSPISEVIALSNKCNNDVKRKIRSKYIYKTECYLDLTK